MLASLWAVGDEATADFMTTFYGLLKAGARAGNADLVKSGVRGVNTALGEAPADRGVFDLLAMAAAYNFARTHLARDPSFTAARAVPGCRLSQTS